MLKRTLSFLLVLVMALGLCQMAVAEENRPLKLLVGSQPVDLNTNYVAGLLKEKTGFDVVYEYYTDDKQLALTISGGADYDLYSVNTSMYQTLKGQGALKDISKLLDSYPVIKEAISPLGWTYVTDNEGGIYGIPMVDDAVYAGALCYRTDIFAKYGYTEPSTIDEFEALLRKIKEDTGLIPLTGSSAFQVEIASAFGLSYPLVVDPETDNVISYLRQPGMKDYLAWMNKAYTEGLIDADWPVNKSDDINTKISSTQAVITYGGHWSTKPWVDALVANGETDAYFKNILPLEDATGKRHIPVSNGISLVFVIPADASDEDALYALSLAASRLDADTYWLFNDGIEGTHYTKDADGIPTPIQPIFGEDMQWGDKYQIGRNYKVHPFSWMARVHKTQVQWDTFYDSNSKAAKYGFEGNPMTFAQFPEYAEYSSALTTLCNDYFMQVIAGTESLDTYDAFVEEWEASGGLELEAAATEWYHNNTELVEAACNSYSPYSEYFGYVIEK